MSMIGRPIHRFLKNQNYCSDVYHRIRNRPTPFENTLTILKDPANDRELYLIGTTNSSTLLAKRTRDIIKNESPDTVYVQTNEKWWNLVKDFKNVNSQKELNLYNPVLRDTQEWHMENNPRSLVFKTRFYPWMFTLTQMFGFPSDFHPFTPGLEMKYAIEQALAGNSKLIFGGQEINPGTLYALRTEKRFDLVPLIWRYFFALHNKKWETEHQDLHRVLDVAGGEGFAEVIDNYRLAWLIKLFEKYAPFQKQILIDHKDLDLFYQLYRAPGKKIVAVVNQWHTPGIEYHWRHTTHTELPTEPINPVGDFDIDTYQEVNTINDAIREYVCKLGKTEPATYDNYITHYHKQTQEAERSRHVHFLSHDDPHMSHH